MDENRNKKCPLCDSEQPEDSAFCGECGAKMSQTHEQNPDSHTTPARDNFNENHQQYQYQPQYQPQQQMYPHYEMNPLDTPLSLGEYLLMIIAFMIPIIGFILMIVWSVSSSTNTNRKNFSRAMLIIRIVSTIITIILSIALSAFFYALIEEIYGYGDISNFFYEYDMSIFRRFLPW